MREDHMEKLDKMFPDGWICVYTCPNKTVRMSLYNPEKLEILEDYHHMLKEVADDE